MMPRFSGALNGDFEHTGGPAARDRVHVANWAGHESTVLAPCPEGGYTFDVCPNHMDPEDCDCGDEIGVSTYRFIVSSVSLDGVPNGGHR